MHPHQYYYLIILELISMDQLTVKFLLLRILNAVYVVIGMAVLTFGDLINCLGIVKLMHTITVIEFILPNYIYTDKNSILQMLYLPI